MGHRDLTSRKDRFFLGWESQLVEIMIRYALHSFHVSFFLLCVHFICQPEGRVGVREGGKGGTRTDYFSKVLRGETYS